jgi:hypothetical protein
MTPVTVEPTQASATGVRRSGRTSKEIPILLSGADAAGRQFSENTRTLVLSLHGASVICHHKLIPEQEAYLLVISNNREMEVRVCGQIGEREDGYIYGVAFADPEVDFWHMEFPPAQVLPADLIPVTLECSGCHRQVFLQFDATEMDVYTVNEGSLRYCSRCALSTIWKTATPQVQSKLPAATPKTVLFEPRPVASTTEIRSPVAASPAPPPQSVSAPATVAQSAATAPAPPIPPPPPISAPVAAAPSIVAPPPPVKPPQPNRRSERRTKVKYNACIRVSGWGEEVVPCEDMSRGGFCFQSNRQYSIETMIEAAVPYTLGGVSIFVAAQIANAATLQDGLFRYGVAYIRSPRK